MINTGQQSINFIGKKHISDFTFLVYNVLSLGVVYVLCRIFKNFEVAVKTSNCNLEEADCVMLEDQYHNVKLVKVVKMKVKSTLGLNRYTKNQHCRILDTPYCRFIYDYKLGKFCSPNFTSSPIRDFAEHYQSCLLKSREEEEVEIYEKRIIYGDNSLGLEIPDIFSIIINHLFSPLSLLEFLSIFIWISVSYYNYTIVVGGIYLYLFQKGLFNDIRNRNELKKSIQTSTIRVFRNGSFRELPETEILPGDMIYIDSTENFKCDCEILKGDVITDESFLTGESVPICKGPKGIVYSGTKVIKSTSLSLSINNVQLEKLVKVKNLIRKPSESVIEDRTTNKTEDVAIGRVLKTGKKTKRGLLLKNLMVRKPSVNIFCIQSKSVILYLSISSITITFLIFLYLLQYLSLNKTCRYAFDLGITFFNPALYTALELGAQYARDQLAKKNVNTTETDRINTAGEVDMIVFDKTGTLTELGVDILNIDTIDSTIESIDNIDPIIHMGLSTCHYVLELDNQYSGDILDMKMFLFSRSKIVNREGKRFIDLSSNNEYVPICKEQNSENEADSVLFFDSVGSKTTEENFVEVLKIRDFDLYVKRISVVVKTKSGKMYLFCKGAPDSICKILQSVPEEYNEKVKEYSLQGHRVLTMAYKEISEYGKREVDESELKFIGFIVFANRLKEETEGVIKELREANIHPKMCTGDNILTAISVARECKMIDSDMPVLFPVVEENLKTYHDADWFCVADEDYVFDKIKMELYMDFDRSTAVDFVVAIEGKEFEFFRNTVYHSFILEKGVVFARFNPDNKKELIEDYSNNNYVTMFCGDGANDTGALSSADVGLSLSSNEASLAASFNSRNITAALDLIKEGRSALSMSASQFKYVFYSQVLAGLQMVALLFYLYFPADIFSLVNDLMSCYFLAYSLSTFKASSKIFPRKISVNLSKGCFHLSIELLLLLIVFTIVSYYFGFSNNTESISITSKNSTAIFFSMMLLLIYRAWLFANFGPHRSSRFGNWFFLAIIGGCSLFCLILSICLLLPVEMVVNKFQSTILDPQDKIVTLVCLLTCFSIVTVSHILDKSNFSYIPNNSKR